MRCQFNRSSVSAPCRAHACRWATLLEEQLDEARTRQQAAQKAGFHAEKEVRVGALSLPATASIASLRGG